ncbi:MAG TPA: hypothetical protein VFZ35_06750 [Sphingomicrobium sp.]
MSEPAKVTEARLEADRARARLLESFKALETPLLELKEQLTPRRIMGEFFEGAKSKGADLAEEAVDAVRARPIAATGVVTAIALFLAREPLIDLAGKLVDGVKKKPDEKAKKEAKPAPKRSKPAAKKQTSVEKG